MTKPIQENWHKLTLLALPDIDDGPKPLRIENTLRRGFGPEGCSPQDESDENNGTHKRLAR